MAREPSIVAPGARCERRKRRERHELHDRPGGSCGATRDGKGKVRKVKAEDGRSKDCRGCRDQSMIC